MVSVDLIVVNYKTYPLIQKFIDSYEKYKPLTESRLVVIDNSSDLAEAKKLRLGDGILYSFKQNLGYARACNYGSTLSNSKYIGFFNSDTEFINNPCIDICIKYLEDHPDVGVVGPFQYAPENNRITHAGIFGPGDAPKMRGWNSIDRGQYRDVEECLTVSGSAFIVRREAWDIIKNDPTYRKHWPDALGAMPEHFLYYEETALCYAMPKFGYKVVYLGTAEMIHHWHKSIKKFGDNSAFKESQRMFRALMDDWGIIHD